MCGELTINDSGRGRTPAEEDRGRPALQATGQMIDFSLRGCGKSSEDVDATSKESSGKVRLADNAVVGQ